MVFNNSQPEVNLDITDKNIGAARINPFECPIAKAMEDAELENPTVNPNSDGFVYWGYGNQYRAKLPTNALAFIRHFDGKLKVLPFKLKLKTEVRTGIARYERLMAQPQG